MEERFDLVVVGAGPAGIAAAYTAAKEGLKVILFERGENPGSKNMFGGVLYGHALAEIIPNFWEEAPIERSLVEERYWIMSEDSMATFSHKTKRYGQPPFNGFSVLRAKFDKWFADKAVEAGALLVCETLVEKLIVEDGKCIGVQTGRADGDVYADAVIVADGVNSLLTRDVGIHKEWSDQEVGVGVKEIIALPREKIEDRFNLGKDEGVHIQLMGEATKGMTGGGFVYTNTDSISIGLIALTGEVYQKGICPNDLIDDLKSHPMIEPLIEGGESKEYSAHMIPERGFKSVPELVHDGFLIVGDAAMLVNNLSGEGVNLAITSGKLAAEAVLEAKQSGDFTKAGLSHYETALDNSHVLQDLKKYQGFTDFLHQDGQLLDVYPKLITEALETSFLIDGRSRKEKSKEVKELIKKKKSYWQIAQDAWKGWRAIK